MTTLGVNLKRLLAVKKMSKGDHIFGYDEHKSRSIETNNFLKLAARF